MAPAPFTVVFLLFPGITQLDFTAPAQALSRMPGAVMVGAAAQHGPIVTDSGFAILPTHDFTNCPPADLFIVPGGHGVTPAIGDAATIAFIKRQANSARWVASVCTGAFLLGQAGLLRGKRATTHWAYHHLLPLVGAEPVHARVVEDGSVITAGGVTSGIDFALTMIAREAGEDAAKMVQLAIEYDPAPPFVGGHPDRADAGLVDRLQSRVYAAAAETMASAIINAQR